MITDVFKLAESHDTVDNNDTNPADENRDAIVRPPPAGEASRGATYKRYIKSAITLVALVSAMAISIPPFCTKTFDFNR